MSSGRVTLCIRGAASLARKVYMRQNLGVGILRTHYGGRNKRKVTILSNRIYNELLCAYLSRSQDSCCGPYSDGFVL